ncbi:hypothetical protein ACQPW1_28010 [Nocardia sp. CA-128927]|uniref:WXG100-like domain-containing protein n=1 Tax=Nocardia sp. CA-128927 TaxID=3239975 RepID=UPI003D96CFF0
MSLYLPEELRWLGWIAGSNWPDGDEDAMWAVAAAWKTASGELEALLSQIDAAKRDTVRAYPQGAAAEEMGKLFDGLRSGDQSLESLAQLLQQISDSSFDLGTQLQATKLTIVISLCWLAMEILWAWLFPPTAPAVEAAAITTTRSFLRVFEDMVQKAITNLARKLGASAEKRYFWKSLAGGRFVLPTAKGWGVYGVKFGESAITSAGLNAAVQLGQMADGKRRHFDGKEFGVSVFASAAGTLPSREFARYLGRGIDKWAGRSLDNVWGRTGRGAFIGAASGVVGSAAGNVAVGVATGDWSSFTSPAGWVGGAARGGLVGGARGGFAKSSPISRGDVRFPVWMHKPGAPRTPPSDVASHGSSGGSSRSGGSSIEMQSLNGGGSGRSGSTGGGTGGRSTHSSSYSGGGDNSSGNGGRGSSHGGGDGASNNGGRSHGGDGSSINSGSHGGDGASNNSGRNGSHGGDGSSNNGGRGSSYGGEGSTNNGSRGTGPAPSTVESGGGSRSSQPTPVGNGSVSHQSPPAVRPADGTVRGDTNSRGTLDSDGRSFHTDRGTLDSQGQSFHTGRGTLDSQGQSFHTARDSFHSAQESLGGGQSSVHGSNSDGGSTGSGRDGFVPPTSWQSSVDGGWRPPSSHGSVVDPPPAPGSSTGGGSRAGTPIPGSPVPGGSVNGQSSGSSVSSGASGTGSSSTGPHSGPPSGGPGSTHSGDSTNSRGSQNNHGAPRPDPFLGPGKDMKGKTRPKLLPHWEPLPGGFDAPDAPDASAWMFGPSEDDPPKDTEGGTGDVPFTLNGR